MDTVTIKQNYVTLFIIYYTNIKKVHKYCLDCMQYKINKSDNYKINK